MIIISSKMTNLHSSNIVSGNIYVMIIKNYNLQVQMCNMSLLNKIVNIKLKFMLNKTKLINKNVNVITPLIYYQNK